MVPVRRGAVAVPDRLRRAVGFLRPKSPHLVVVRTKIPASALPGAEVRGGIHGAGGGFVQLVRQ